jgi:dUTP pyrophosphatase
LKPEYVPFQGPNTPEYATPGSAGADIRVIETKKLAPGQTHVFGTGLRCAIPDGYVMLIFSRSGLSIKNKLMLPNGVGVIDSDYRGEIKVALINMSDQDQWVSAGERVAQAVIVPHIQAKFYHADQLDETERGEGGFGSTGI